MEQTDVPELVHNLRSSDESKRKKAAFTLQGVIGDPSFADTFIAEGGIQALQNVLLHASGNTLAYGLASMYNLLNLDQGWEYITKDVVERLVGLIVAQPIVNILRGTMSILASAISRPEPFSPAADAFSAQQLKRIIDSQPKFLEMVVDRLNSADHALCATALQLVNALMRDALNNDSDWPKFVKNLQELGVIKAAYDSMQNAALHELVQPLLDFQNLTKTLLQKWKHIQVDFGLREHRRALRAVYTASWPESTTSDEAFKDGQKHEPERWRRLGFSTESPAWDFEEVGYLGMMDLTEFVRKSESGFEKLLLEQSNKAPEKRCPFARASLAVTSILYEHFEVDRSDAEEQQRYAPTEGGSNYDRDFKPLLLQWSRLHTSGVQAFFRLWVETGAEADDLGKIEELVRILIEHVVGLATRARDIHDIENQLSQYELKTLRELQMELLELNQEEAWGQHLRQIKDDLQHEALQFVKEQRIRCLLQGSWFPNPSLKLNKRSEYRNRADDGAQLAWRYVRLSPNRRFLHYHEFATKAPKSAEAPTLETLSNKIDLTTVTSVVSNVSAPSKDDKGYESNESSDDNIEANTDDPALPANPSEPSSPPSASLVKSPHQRQAQSPQGQRSRRRARKQDPTDRTNTTITIHGFIPTSGNLTSSPPYGGAATTKGGSNPTRQQPSHLRNQSSLSNNRGRDGASPTKMVRNGEEGPLLSLRTHSSAHAAEWIDGLLMLLGQEPIMSETKNLVQFISQYGLRIRLLNVRVEDEQDLDAGDGDDATDMKGVDGGASPRGNRNVVDGLGIRSGTGVRRKVRLPDRSGLDDDYFYDIPV